MNTRALHVYPKLVLLISVKPLGVFGWKKERKRKNKI